MAKISNKLADLGDSWGQHYGPGCSNLFLRLTSWEIRSNLFCPSQSQLQPWPGGQKPWGLPTACPHQCHPCRLFSMKPDPLGSHSDSSTSFGEVSSWPVFILLRRKLNPRGWKQVSLHKINQDKSVQASLSSKQGTFLCMLHVLNKISHLQGEVSFFSKF